MKVNFQKLMIIFLVVPMCIGIFAIPAYAEDESNEHGGTGGSFADVSTSDKYFDAVWGEIYSYANGNMSFDEFNKRVDSLTENYRNSNTIDGVLGYGVDNFATKVTALTAKVGSLAAQFGEGCLDIIKDYFENSFKDYEVLRDESTFDLRGYGAAISGANYHSDVSYEIFFCDYIILNLKRTEATMRGYKACINLDGEFKAFSKPVNLVVSLDEHMKLYGDIRYENGEKAPTDDEYVQVPDGFDFGDLKYNELNSLLDKMLEALNRQQPDLSSIEGILQAIYYRLGTLDSDNDNGTLSLLNSAISQLISSNNKNNQALIEKLESLKGGSGESGGEEEDSGGVDIEGLRELLKELMPEIDDMTGTEQVKAALLSKFSFIEELKSLIQRFISSYKNSSSNKPVITLDFGSGLTSGVLQFLGYHDVDLSASGFFDKYMPTIRAIVAAFIYITFAWNTYKKIPEYINGGGS